MISRIIKVEVGVISRSRRLRLITLTESTLISNGNRTEWSPIGSVIIRVINKIGRPRSGSPICLITTKFVIYRALFKSKHKKFQEFFASNEKKKPFKHARDGAYCPIT